MGSLLKHRVVALHWVRLLVVVLLALAGAGSLRFGFDKEGYRVSRASRRGARVYISLEVEDPDDGRRVVRELSVSSKSMGEDWEYVPMEEGQAALEGLKMKLF